MSKEKINIFWFRRDLRLDDNTGLFHALKNQYKVIPLFIFDTNIIDKIENQNDARMTFIYNEVLNLKKSLEKIGSSLLIKIGKPLDIFIELINEFSILNVFTNTDYEPYALKRDNEIKDLLISKNIDFQTFKDQVIFEKAEILKADGSPYTVFTYYKKIWLKKFYETNINIFENETFTNNYLKFENTITPKLAEIGFNNSQQSFPSKELSISTIDNYANTRDIPSIPTSGIGLHLRFGTVSIRKIVLIAQKHSEVWLNELIWREFFMQILYHFPYVENKAFKPIYNNIEWENNENDFQRWCEGKTGYAIVDAGIRELNETGFMHNRVRMITASFLCKHLLIDWKWGEAYFAKHLLDYELSSNNGNWQWAAGTGCDAAPYFRIFNPLTQTQRFDPKHIYIKKWVNELNELNYNQMIDHQYARERCLKIYKKIF